MLGQWSLGTPTITPSLPGSPEYKAICCFNTAGPALYTDLELDVNRVNWCGFYRTHFQYVTQGLKSTHLFCSVSELLDAEVFVEISANKEEAEFGPEPDEGVRDADHHHFSRLSALLSVRAAVPDPGNKTRWRGLAFNKGLIAYFGYIVIS